MHPRRSVFFSYCLALLVALFLAGGFFIGAAPVHAQEGIVACTGVANSYDQNAVPCGTCEFIATFNNVIDFMVVLASIVSTIAIVIIGLRLVTSGGSEAVKTQAKQAMGYIAMGLFLLIGAYAIVGAIITALVPDTGENSDIRNWRDFNTCIYATPPRAPQLTNEGTGGGPGGTTSGSERDGSDHSGVADPGTGGPLPQCSEGNDACSVSALQQAGLTEQQANVMSCIAMTESSGIPSWGPHSDRNPGSGSTACGTFQITGSTWRDVAPAGCANHRLCCTNAEHNKQAMVSLVRTRGYQPWTCEGCNAKAIQCVRKYSIIPKYISSI